MHFSKQLKKLGTWADKCSQYLLNFSQIRVYTYPKYTSIKLFLEKITKFS